MKILWIVGPPGVGKTTAARLLIGPIATRVATPKWTCGDGVVAAGHYTGATFDGADTVPYNGAAAALAYWDAHFHDVERTIFDGDRFSNATTLAWAQTRGELFCALLDAPSTQLAARRAARGSTQNPAWMKGRATKATRFQQSVHDAGGRIVTMDAGFTTPEALAGQLRRWF